MKKTLKDRESEFIRLCEPYFEKYGKQMIKEFVEYWTECNLNGKKMRFEKEKTFGLSRRLSTWKRNNEKWGKKDFVKTEKISPMQTILQTIKNYEPNSTT